MKKNILALLEKSYNTLKNVEISIIENNQKDIVTEGDLLLGNLIREECLKWNYPLCIYTEEFDETIRNSENPEYFVFVDELDGTDNAYRGIRIFPSVTLIQIAKCNNSNNIHFEDFIAVGAVEHSRGEIYVALKDEGIEKYHILDNFLEKIEIVSKHPKQDVAITDIYSMMNEPEILKTIASTLQTKDFGASAASYCYVAEGLFEAYVSSHKKGHELPLLYMLCKESGLQMTDFAGRSYDKVKYDFNSKRYQIIAGISSTTQKLIDELKVFAKDM